MMKNIIYILFFALSLPLFVSCDATGPEGAIYNAKNDEVSFPKASSSYTLGAGDPDQYDIVLQRGNAAGAVSVPVTLEDASGFFSAPASASFADGDYETTLRVTFNRSQLAVGLAYQITLTLPENPVKERIVKHTASITRDYVWQYFTTGTFSSAFFEEEWEQVIQKAEGTDAYKLPSLIAEGVDMIFYVADNGSLSFPGSPTANGLYRFATGYMHPSYGMVYFELDPDLEYSFFDKEKKLAVFNGQYAVSAGNFGWFDEVLTW